MKTFFLILASIFTVSVHGYPDVDARAMTALDILNIPEIYSPKISPDGKKIAFIKSVSNWKKNKNVSDVWLVDLDSNTTRQLTFTPDSERRLSWSPDGKYLSFIGERSKDKYERLYLLPMSGGEAFAVGDHERDMGKYIWGKHSRFVYFIASEPLSGTIKKRRKTKDDMFPFEEGLSFRHLWKLDIKDKKIQQLTKGDYYISGFDLSKDNSLIAFNKRKGITIDDKHSAEIWVMDAQGKNHKQLTDNAFAEWRIRISPNNDSILFLAGVNENGEYYFDENLFVVDVATKELELIKIKQEFEVEGAEWSRNGKVIYLKANSGVRSELWALQKRTGKLKALTTGDHTVTSWSYDANNNAHVFTLVTPENPGDLWILKGGKSSPVMVTKQFKNFSKSYHLPKQQLVQWKAKDGTLLEGLLSLPLNYKEGERYPLVTHVHGGPKSSDQFGQFRWRTYIPLVTAMGYAYFTPNHRGGRGYGDKFLRDMVGGYFNNAHTDVLSGVDHLIERGIVDPDKLAISGWSAGGHMTNKLITFTNRFKAASSGAGAVDWVSMYGESDNRYYRTFWFGGTPWEENAPLEVYRKHSPLKDIWKVKTPTLIFVGQRDVRVPKTQSILLFRALKDQGVKAKLYIAPREKHRFKELRHKLFKINAELAWYEKYVRGKHYDWEKAPDSNTD